MCRFLRASTPAHDRSESFFAQGRDATTHDREKFLFLARFRPISHDHTNATHGRKLPPRQRLLQE